MATVNKNFRIKNGLVVEGSTATVNGQNILTETGSDTYILNLIGGETLVKSVGWGLKVDGSGLLDLDLQSGSGLNTTPTSGLAVDTSVIATKTYVDDAASTVQGNLEDHASDTTTHGVDGNIVGTTDTQTLSNKTLAGTTYIKNGITELTVGTIDANSSNLEVHGNNSLLLSGGTGDVVLSTGMGSVYVGSSSSGNEIATESYVDTAIGNIDLSYTTDDVTEGTNLYFTNQRALDATSAAYDAAGAAATAQSNAEDYADGLAGNYDPAGAALTAEGNANTYTDTHASDTSSHGVTGDIVGTTDAQTLTNKNFEGSITFGTYPANKIEGGMLGVDIGSSYNLNLTANKAVVINGVDNGVFIGSEASGNEIATHSYVDTAVNNLIDGAPGLLDTLNEIAAAINDDANYFTTVANAINAKQDALTAGSNISIDGSNVISVTGLDTDDVAEGSNLYFTDTRARNAVDGTDRSFTSVAINEVAKQVAATTGNIVTAAATTALSWAKSEYRSGKFTVKVKNGSHTEISEILVTLDTSDNVAITEYGIVGTNGSLGTVSADVSGSDVRIRVTPANNNSEVMVVGTLLI